MRTIFFAFFLLLFVSCGSDDETLDYKSLNEKEIQDYLLANDLEAEKTATGLYYIVEDQGTGSQPAANSNVRVAYKGYFTNGTVFDQSSPEGVRFNLQQVIKGWTEGITYFKEGGSGLLLVPSHLGYGPANYRSIPGGSVLIFEIKLLEVN